MDWRASALRLALATPGFDRLFGRPRTKDGVAVERTLHALGVLEDRFDAKNPTDARSLARYRRESEAMMALLGPAADAEVAVRDIALDGPAGPIPARVYTPPGGAPPRPGLVYLHGGGWAMGSLDSHHGTCTVVAKQSGAVVVSIDYRLAPEHPFPAAWDDVLAAFRQVVARAGELGVDPARVGVGGDSAGGVLSVWVGRATRGDAIRPRGLWLVYPGADFTRKYPSERELGTGLILTSSRIDWYLDQVAPDRDTRLDPRLSPALADLDELPPVRLVLAAFDPLFDEGRVLGDGLEAAGVELEVVVYDNLTHGFVNLGGVSEASARALRDEAAAVRRLLG